MWARYSAPNLQISLRERSFLFPFVQKVPDGRNSEDVATLLRKLGSHLTVTLLLESLQQALEFEAFMNRKYGSPVNNGSISTTFLFPLTSF